MLDVNVLGITPDIKLKIIENVSVSEIRDCAERVEEYCNRYQCIDGVLQNDLFTLKVMYRFTHYMNAVNFDWMPICYTEFREHIEREVNNIEDKIIDGCEIEIVLG